MNTYKVTATRQDGTQISDTFTERTESAARKSFKECYRHDKYTIDSIELTGTGALASKQQERDTLETIKKLVEDLGPDSYLATAFSGCFEIAEWNIDCDGADSMASKAMFATEQAKEHKAQAKQLRGRVTELERVVETLEAEIEALKNPAPVEEPPVEITDELIDDIVAFTDIYVYEVRAAVLQNIETIAKDATLTKLLHEHAIHKWAEAEEYRRDMMNAVRHGDELRPANHCLTHAGSYRDIIYDLLRPYWSSEEVQA